MDTVKDVGQLLVWIGGLIGGLIAAIGAVIAAFQAIHEMRNNRSQRISEEEQRKSEHRWRQAELSKEILDEIWSSELGSAAMKMLDWSNREFAIQEGQHERITREDVKAALRVTDVEFNAKEVFIRDCFDDLLDSITLLEHFITIQLIHFGDVKHPIKYYVEELSGDFRKIIDRYTDEYAYRYAQNFFNRYKFWTDREDRSRGSCIAVDPSHAAHLHMDGEEPASPLRHFIEPEEFAQEVTKESS
jgi:hypothetical protein